MSETKGDPAIINDVGNRCLTAGMDLHSTAADTAGYGTFDLSSLGEAGNGALIVARYERCISEAHAMAENLAAVLEEDGYHLQRASRDLDVVMGGTEGSPESSGPGTTGGGPTAW